ncbi:MAG TPA: hypothetical protein VFA52_01140 [Candidatus Paceibacterota bacterium]|nr:hypothetical protein [Candidatus Paceibacterota bacterium]
MKKFTLATFLLLSLLIGSTSHVLADSQGSTGSSSFLKFISQAFIRRGGDHMMGTTTVKASTTVRDDFRARLASSTASTTLEASAKAKADDAINKRINSLNQLSARVAAMAKLSTTTKASLAASIQASITDMTNLKTKIDADTDAAVLKTDIASITASYRIYALVIPQVEIAVAADRTDTLVDMMNIVAGKFQSRITAATNAGKDTASLNIALSDYQAKIADAKIQANAAASLVVSLSPDNRDKNKAESNKQALQSARAKLKAARIDLKTARDDAETIRRGLRSFGRIGVTASSSASSTTH